MQSKGGATASLFWPDCSLGLLPEETATMGQLAEDSFRPFRSDADLADNTTRYGAGQ